MTHFKRTKIVATAGPAITKKLWSMDMYNDPKNSALVKEAHQNMADVIKAGATTIRFNFSHGSHAEQDVRLKIVREEAAKLKMPVSIMLDTKGPEIRIGKMVEGEASFVKMGSSIAIHCLEDIEGDATKFSVKDASGKYDMAKDLSVGKTVLVDDGKLPLEVTKIDKANSIVYTKALNSRQLITNKRINLPNTKYSLPFISEKDRTDIKYACDHDLDYIALSFVNTADNVKEIRNMLKEFGNTNIKLIAKIESTHGIENIDEIIAEADAIMVARGDLGLEIPYEDVPYWQKYIIKACRFIGKPVIVATQMLDSLEKQTQPTRAEVTDVFFAVDRGTDSTMLSGETANGLFPVHAVDVMTKIDARAEEMFDYERSIGYYFPHTKASQTNFGRAVLSLAKKVEPIKQIKNTDFNYDYAVYFTNNNAEIRTLSNVHAAVTMVIVTDDKKVYTGYGIEYGIRTILVNDLSKYTNDQAKHAKTLIKDLPKFHKQYLLFDGKKLTEI